MERGEVVVVVAVFVGVLVLAWNFFGVGMFPVVLGEDLVSRSLLENSILVAGFISFVLWKKYALKWQQEKEFDLKRVPKVSFS